MMTTRQKEVLRDIKYRMNGHFQIEMIAINHRAKTWRVVDNLERKGMLAYTSSRAVDDITGLEYIDMRLEVTELGRLT